MRLGDPLGRDRFGAVAFYPDGNALASATDNGTIEVWDMPSGKSKLRIAGHGDWNSSVVFSVNGKRPLAAESFGGVIRLLDLADGAEPDSVKGHDPGGLKSPMALALSHDGGMLAYELSNVTLGFCNVGGPRTIAELPLPGGYRGVNCLAFSPDGRHLACGAWGERVLLFDSATGNLAKALDLSPSNALQEGRPVWLSGTDVLSIAFSKDGRSLAFGDADNAVRTWDIERDSETWEVEVGPELGGSIRAIAFSPGGAILTSAHGPGIRIWEAAGGKPLLDIKVHEGAITCLAYSPDGSRLASASEDGTILVWDMELLEDMWTKEPGGSLVWDLPEAAKWRQEVGAGDM